MTQKSIPNGCITRYFHSNLINISDEIKITLKKIDSLFSNLLPAFLRGEVDSLKVDELISAREILLFYLLQTPTGVFSSDNMFSSLAYSIETFLDPKTKKETKEIIRTDDVKEALVQMMLYGIDLLDM